MFPRTFGLPFEWGGDGGWQERDRVQQNLPSPHQTHKPKPFFTNVHTRLYYQFSLTSLVFHTHRYKDVHSLLLLPTHPTALHVARTLFFSVPSSRPFLLSFLHTFLHIIWALHTRMQTQNFFKTIGMLLLLLLLMLLLLLLFECTI